jgi:6-phosphogluconolactonase
MEADLRERGHCAVALAGGGTPRPVYERLALDPYARRVGWAAVEVYFGDERAVPATDPESNFGMAAAALLDRVPIPASRVHRMEADARDADAAARAYERLLPDALDVLLLGVGQDGHTASLFPGAAALEERTRRVVPVIGPKPPPRRLTITPPVIAAARRIVVLAAGADKAEAVARGLEGPWRPADCPVQLARRGIWFLDREAAARLRSAAA